VHLASGDVDATVVLYDPDRDVAVLAVPGLDVAPLAFAPAARTGDGAVVVGYPQDGPFRADAARVRGTQDARGPDIYQRRTVVREIYALRARVRPGNSGGPLVSPGGKVYGVVFAAAADDPQTGYALTAKEVAGDAARGRTATSSVSTQGCD
jgi:S1-C subfamily serine protease